MDWQTPGWRGAAIRVVQHLDRDGDGSLSAAEAPGAKGLDTNGKAGIQAGELQAWMEGGTDSFERAEMLDHLSWSWLDDPKKLEAAENACDGWKKATIATGIIAGVLAVLGVILLLTGVGAGAAVALFVAATSAVACPIAAAEFNDAQADAAKLKREVEEHRGTLAAELAQATARGPIAALAPPKFG